VKLIRLEFELQLPFPETTGNYRASNQEAKQ